MGCNSRRLLPVLRQQPCRCHRCSLRDEQSGSNGQPLLLFLSMSTFVSSPCCSHHFCFKHGRVNLHILQAASLPIYLSSCFPPLSFFQTGLCCQALSERWGCHEWWMTINLLLSSTTLLGDLQARWLPGMKTNLSFSFFPPILHPCRPRSFNLASRISTSPLLPKKLL